MTTKAQLLDELEPLTHRDRMKRLVELGRGTAASADAKALVDGLAASTETYERSLAVATVFGSHDGALLLRLLDDPSRVVRSRAAKLVALACDDQQAVEALRLAVSATARRALATRLRRKGRTTALDAFLSSADLGADRTLADLLPLSGEGVMTKLLGALDALEPLGSQTAWNRVVTRHAGLFVKYVDEKLQRQPTRSLSFDPRLRWRLVSVAERLATRNPEAGLWLVRVLLEGDEDPNSQLMQLLVPGVLRAFPQQTFDALRARHERGEPARPPGAFGVVQFDKVAHRLGAERLAYLVEHAWATLRDGERGRRWFLKLSDVDRAAVLDTWIARGRGAWGAFLLRYLAADGQRADVRRQAFERWRTQAMSSEGIIAVHVLDCLPADLRREEARRHAELPVLSTRPDARNLYASLLPFDDAKSVLAPFLGHPEGDERAKAVRPLLGTVRHEPTNLAAALAVVRSRKFEQDPVRFAMLDALAILPQRAFTTAHLDDLAVIVADALDAADLSQRTAAAVERLIVRSFRVDARWGATWLTTFLEKRGAIGAQSALFGLDGELLASDVERLAAGLEQLATTWATQERAAALLWLARSLGCRLRHAPALVGALERMAHDQPFFGVSASVLELLRTRVPARFAALAPKLVKEDPSTILVDCVATFVSVHRQDLLAPFVSNAPMTGRYATGRSSWVIRFSRGHGRWTQQQQRQHADAWGQLLADETRDVPTLIGAVAELAALSFAARDALLPYASDPRAPLRETAIRALPWLDVGQGVPTLIACLGDDRARWAIYALRKAFSEMKRARVLAHLRDAPMNKVTVAKEVVRLLGELGGADAYAALRALDDDQQLHRDVRIALLRALWDHLEHDATWPIFERAVSHPDWIVASKFADVPLGKLSARSQARVVALLVKILGRPEPEARLDLLRRCAYLPVTDDERTLFRALVAHLGVPRPDEAVAAAQAMLVRMRPTEVDVVLARLRELYPRRQLMVQLVPAFTPYAYSAAHVRALANGVLALLRDDPLATPQYVRFAGRVVGYEPLFAALDHLARHDFLHADVMVAAYEAIGACLHPALLEARLSGHPNPRMRRLGVEALKHAASPKHGWTAERRAKLDAYRRDPAPLVAGAAAYVFPPD